MNLLTRGRLLLEEEVRGAKAAFFADEAPSRVLTMVTTQILREKKGKLEEKEVRVGKIWSEIEWN